MRDTTTWQFFLVSQQSTYRMGRAPPLPASILGLCLLLPVVVVVEGRLQPSDYFLCQPASRGLLLPPSVRCDGYPDCPHGDDELGCSGRPQARPPPVFPGSHYAAPPSPFRPSQSPEIPQECFSPPPASGCPVFWVRPTTRWFYNPGTDSCSQFQYTCGRGFNNFHTLSNCRSLCQPGTQPRPQSRPPALATPSLTRNNFNNFLYRAPNSLLEFYADWCGACQSFNPQFEMAAASLQQYNVQCGRVNIDRERELARLYGVNRVPYVILIRNNSRQATWNN